MHPTSKNATETIRHPSDSTTDKTKQNSPNISGPLKMQTNPFKLNGKLLNDDNPTVTLPRNVTYVCMESLLLLFAEKICVAWTSVTN